MEKESQFLIAYRKLQDIYARLKTFVAYSSLLILIVVAYADELIGPLRDILFPAAAVILLGIMLETLFNLSGNLTGFLQMQTYDSIVTALPKIIEVMSRSRKDTHTISLIVITGGTTFNAIFPYIRAMTKRNIRLEILLMDPKSPMMQFAPRHWSNEITSTLTRLQAEYINGEVVKIQRCALYQNLPAIHGILINDNDLFLGHVGWERTPSGEIMAGAQKQHRYYSLNSFSQHYFELFRDWTQFCPVREIDLSIDLPSQL